MIFYVESLLVIFCFFFFFFFKQKTAYEMRISDWSSDVCSSDLVQHDSPKRLLVLRDHQRERSARAGRFLQPGARRAVGRHRHREGKGIQAGDRKSVV